MSERKLRVGIIGIGMYAFRNHAARLKAMANAELVAISRRSPEALAGAKEVLAVEGAYTDWRELLDHPGLEAVIVATAHRVHAEPTIAALERGLPVLVEKPMALTSADAWAMVRAAERANRVLMVGYNRRCVGGWRAAAKALRSGLLGTVRQLSLTVSYNLRWFWESTRMPAAIFKAVQTQSYPPGWAEGRTDNLEGYWRCDPAQMGGGGFADTGSHFVDLALWLGGAPAVEVAALAASPGLAVETNLGIQARLANGALLSLTSADGVPAGAHHLTVYGDGGTLTVDWVKEPDMAMVVHRPQGRENLAAEIPDTNTTAAFVDTVLSGAPNLSPARDGAHAVALSEAAYLSAAEGRIVKLEAPAEG